MEDGETVGEYKLPDSAEFIERCEDELWCTIAKMRKGGVRYKVIHMILNDMIKVLDIQGYCEDWLDKFLPREEG